MEKKILIRFSGQEETWSSFAGDCYHQRDGINCGPIACLCILELYGLIKTGSIENIARSNAGIRGYVMNVCTHLTTKHMSNLYFLCRSHLDVLMDGGKLNGQRITTDDIFLTDKAIRLI